MAILELRPEGKKETACRDLRKEHSKQWKQHVKGPGVEICLTH